MSPSFIEENYALVEDGALFLQETSGLNSSELVMALTAVAALLFIANVLFIGFAVWRRHKLRKLEKWSADVGKKEQAMAKNLEVYKIQNKKLRDEMVRLRKEFVEERRRIKQKEFSINEKSAELEKGLLKVRAMEETVNMHRTKIGLLEKKNRELLSRSGGYSPELEAQLKAEKERYEAKIGELKEETKEIMSAFAERKETELMGLKRENEELKKELERLKGTQNNR